MIAQDYKEIADEIQYITWDIEDAIYTDTNFSVDRMEGLKKLHHKCEMFMAEFEKYQKLRGKE
jgi:hypothetical protein